LPPTAKRAALDRALGRFLRKPQPYWPQSAFLPAASAAPYRPERFPRGYCRHVGNRKAAPARAWPTSACSCTSRCFTRVAASPTPWRLCGVDANAKSRLEAWASQPGAWTTAGLSIARFRRPQAPVSTGADARRLGRADRALAGGRHRHGRCAAAEAAEHTLGLLAGNVSGRRNLPAATRAPCQREFGRAAPAGPLLQPLIAPPALARAALRLPQRPRRPGPLSRDRTPAPPATVREETL